MIYLFYELNRDELANTAAFLEMQLGDTVDFVHSLEALKGNFKAKQADRFICLHLDLEHEIDTHIKLSEALYKANCNLLNPYTEVAKLADDKFAFYNFCVAQDYSQPKTFRLDDLSKIIKEDLEPFSSEDYILKPCHGTEKIDFDKFSIEHLEKILSYDSALLQKRIAFQNEYKILYLNKKFYSAVKLNDELLSFCRRFITDLEAYAKEAIELISMDILESSKDGELIILEINARPAGMYKQAQYIY